MHQLSLHADKPIASVLAIGAHADDIEIGCGGTLLRLAEENPGAEIHWVVLSADGPRVEEARLSAAEFAAGYARSSFEVQGFRDGFFPYDGGAIKEWFEALKGRVSPDVVFAHQRADLHQDHRVVSELTWNTFRNHLIFEYEIPKFDGDFGTPNLFVYLSDSIARRKVDVILSHFVTQHDKRWFTDDLFMASMRLRGMESNSPTGRAEAFYCRKLVI
ncbi:MAG: PIG-L family deacetylase [Chloroflexi bacterium]|nr:MAG: PIG-L family deacetylase [Chloroflexota bacterium]